MRYLGQGVRYLGQGVRYLGQGVLYLGQVQATTKVMRSTTGVPGNVLYLLNYTTDQFEIWYAATADKHVLN